jgi:hypothetical protein
VPGWRDWWYGVYTDDEGEEPPVEMVPIGWRAAAQYGVTPVNPQPGPQGSAQPAPPVEEEEGEVSYIDLGPYKFTTAGDTTGLNPGNLTSMLDTGIIKMAKFELYRLVIGVSNLGLGPIVVQTALGKADSASTPLDISFTNPTTPGNAIIVACATNQGGVPSGITIGGQADNFGAVSGTDLLFSGNDYTIETWVDPDCTIAGTQLAITFTGNGDYAAFAYEVSGLLKVTSAASITDTAETGTGGTSPQLTTGGVTTGSNDFVVGLGLVTANGLVLSLATGVEPATGWTQSQQQQSSAGAYTVVSGYNTVQAAESAVEYGVGWTGSHTAGVNFAAFFSSAVNLPPSLPFTVALDSFIWDVNQTVAGVGYTYDVNKPMYINQGQRIAVLWTDLSTSAYKSVEGNFQITAWFRYDPTIPANAAILGS